MTKKKTQFHKETESFCLQSVGIKNLDLVRFIRGQQIIDLKLIPVGKSLVQSKGHALKMLGS